MNKAEIIAMQFHPRAFAAFGSDLVTNDAVAVTELVKNCYDAFAYNVHVEFGQDASGKDFLRITDDGLGMTRDVIKESWAVIATPYKKKNPTIQRDGKIRRVSGNKGLGRFSAARLGRYLEIITKSNEDTCLSAKIDWDSFTNSGNISDCIITLEETTDDNKIQSDTGTIITISELSSPWEFQNIDELHNALSRLISPFQEVSDFSISLLTPFYAEPTQIKPQTFIQTPTYKIRGHVTSNGTVNWNYTYAPKAKIMNSRDGSILWNEAQRGFDNIHTLFNESEDGQYICGEFSFEIRAWDLDTDSIGDVADTFNIGRSEIRKNISQYKGLSIYRDNVLVLPKSDASKDWLGIDLRRVSHTGKRISTSQIIGMISISSENNPGIRDTTDREKLVDTKEYKQFCRIIETVISILENLRNSDKKPAQSADKPTLSDLISPLSVTTLVEKVEDAVKKGRDSEHILEVVRDFSADTEKNLWELHDRLTYYAQTASLGSVAVVILHEILTGMTVIKRFLKRVWKHYEPFDNKTKEYYEDAETWHSRLVDVANSFAPLYRKNLRYEKHKCNVYCEVENSIRLISGKKEAKNILFECNVDVCVETIMHSGELQTILVNLLDNACYWIQKAGARKKICIKSEEFNAQKIRMTISDTGIGINSTDAEKIFQPGITAKPYGIGMGLVIVTELLNNYDCKIATVIPGELGGATFVFELPIAK
ncbi:sensor histidine kinase [Pelotomaculum sp. PtaB.Bin117]|uniref:ATP-binding protein n=1 Tax=Pelotomaculum sp. PtaB.Bin117 TaxID=1811694 RepID=UPI0009D02CC8|nr:sensor histidine kinase [Pelotomaculum sp. PtaB.Bin117]OPX88157.1 MAG: Sensor protein FixL [Pelotomaculum sp. PtaB.Bin117]